MISAFVYGYKYTQEEIDALKTTVYPTDSARNEDFFKTYMFGPTQYSNEYVIGTLLAETSSQRTIEAEELKFKNIHIRDLKYVMQNLHITEPPKFYLMCIE